MHFVGCPQACPFLKDSIAQRLAYFHPDPTELGSIPSIPEIFSAKKIIDYAKVNQWCCSEESGQCFENVDPTHLVLASGKLVQQKMLAFLIHVVVGHFYIGFYFSGQAHQDSPEGYPDQPGNLLNRRRNPRGSLGS